jgi:outer membrane receptor protein involved in Fe transport
VVAGLTPLWGGTTGKIAGRVTDRSTGEPYAGANVVVEGTSMGSATDVDGTYTVLQVPPGTYSVLVRAMGYKSMLVTEVRVRIDQTSVVDFALTQEMIQGEEVSVTAKREVVKQDVATSVASVSGQEVQALPMNTVQEVVQLQAGVQDGLVIRGGGADEALFQVDGITLRDPRNNKPITGIALSAIQEVSIERGGFNAEYGQVRSGLVNVVTQEGSRSGYTGSATFKISPPQAKHFGLSPFDRNSMWLRPYLDDQVCWTGTENPVVFPEWDPRSKLWDKYMQQQYPTFTGWTAVSEKLMNDDDPTNDLTPAGAKRLFEWQHRRMPMTDQPDYSVDAGFGGPVPLVGKRLGGLRFFTSYRGEREMLLIPLSRPDYKDYDWSLRLVSDVSPTMKLKVSALLGKSFNVAINATDLTYNGTDFGISAAPTWNPTDYMRTPLEIARITNEQRSGRIFTDSWYCPAEVSYGSWAVQWTHALSAKTYYEVNVEQLKREYRTEPIRPRNTAKVYEVIPGYFVDEAPFGFDPDPTTGIGDNMFFGGHTSTVRDFSRVSSTSFRADLTSQVNFANLVKAGVEFSASDLNLEYGEVNFFTGGRKYTKEHNRPYRGALYVQDKLETKGFILSGGLRLDYSNANTAWVALGLYDRGYFSSSYNAQGNYQTAKANGEWSLSPRLSISHPITENSKLFFNYGHFKQLPSYEQIFRIGRGSSGAANNIGDPNLILAKTVSYELGYDHALFGNYLLQLAAYYHDIKDQQAFVNYISADSKVNYFKATNSSYEDIRGFELTLRKTSGRWWTAFLNYTYEVSSSGFFGYPVIYESPSQQRAWLYQFKDVFQQEKPLPRPYARAHVGLHTPPKYGPRVLGMQPLEDWALTFIGEWRSGGYYTWNENNLRGVSQNVRMRDFTDVTLRLNKTLDFKSVRVTLFMEVENLFNAKTLSGAGFYNGLDQNAYLKSLHLPKSEAYGNMEGNDKVGDFRKSEAFQPMQQVLNAADYPDPDPLVVYYESSTKRYLQYDATAGEWGEVERGRVDRLLKDKAYIDMPNQTSFNFLNPRQIFFGIRMSFDLRSGGPDLRSGGPDLRSGGPDLRSGGPDLRSGGPDLRSGGPDLRSGGPDLRSGGPDLRSGGPDLRSGGPDLR